ncbi:MAG: UDP-N-acetylmuramoyl-tripeptide--D-alanyl-D-alanine ligase, partial [Helicobacter sp.]|nr:UDP-N-acetylmuramoyl-tripeptide--D-alanyl-D-alanine ligase [Helicobacter sp.]
ENIQLAQTIDKHFAIAILTGELNSAILSEHITTASKIILKEKRALESVLKASTQVGDLILFANDAPSYI